MASRKDSPSEIAKQTLIRLAKERLVPLPENYCMAYRAVEGKEEDWATFCRYTKLLEDTLTELIGFWQAPGSLLEPETALIARDLGQSVLAASSEEDLKRVRDTGRDLGLRMKRDLAGSSELQAELMDVMQLIFANLGKFAEEDQWLRTQLQAAEEYLDGRVSADSVAKAKGVLRGLMERQRELQLVMGKAHLDLKAITSELIRQAAALLEDTVGYEDRIAELGEHIQVADDLSSLKNVVAELDHFVKDMGSSVRHSHDDMSATHTRLVQAEQQILDLRKHLADTAERVRRDNLTGALSRSGLEDIWHREVQLAQANGTPLSIGILDVDNFKVLNDQYGHKVGDEALVHLTAVIRNALHGTDTMARYGGEEFVILLPDTDAGGAKAVMKRLQRELTKHFFLRGNDRLLITFSAGVTGVALESDSLISAIERADAALYEAKRLGKNRVSTA